MITKTNITNLREADEVFIEFTLSPDADLMVFDVEGTLRCRKNPGENDAWITRPVEADIPAGITISCEPREKKGVMVYPISPGGDYVIEVECPEQVWSTLARSLGAGDILRFIVCPDIEKSGITGNQRYGELYAEVTKKAGPASAEIDEPPRRARKRKQNHFLLQSCVGRNTHAFVPVSWEERRERTRDADVDPAGAGEIVGEDGSAALIV